MHVGQFRIFVRQAGQFEIVGGEQRQAAVLLDQMAQDGEGQRHAIKRGGAAPDLVHQHQALVRCVVQDGGRLGHLDHEGRAPGSEVVGGADAGEDAVERPEHAGLGRHIAADVGEQGDQRHLAHVGRLAAHVRAGDEQQAAVVGEQAVVGDEGVGLVGQFAFDHRVAAIDDVQLRVGRRIPACTSYASRPIRRSRPAGRAGRRRGRWSAGSGRPAAGRRGWPRRAAFRGPANVPGRTAPCPRRPSVPA